MIAFFDDPSKAPDNSCIAKMPAPAFAVPGQTASVKMVPYTDDQMGFVSVIPEGWEDSGDGVFTRGASSLDETAILQLSGEGANSKTVGQAILAGLGIDTLPKATTTYASSGLTWQVYNMSVTLQGQKYAVAMGLADANGRAFIVLLLSTPEEAESLYKSVFVPVLDAMRAE
jgi:hypothetical protein